MPTPAPRPAPTRILLTAPAAVVDIPHPDGLEPRGQRRLPFRGDLKDPFTWDSLNPLGPSCGDELPSEVERGARRCCVNTASSSTEARAMAAGDSCIELDGREQRLPPFFAPCSRDRPPTAPLLAASHAAGRPAAALLRWRVCGRCITLCSAAPVAAAPPYHGFSAGYRAPRAPFVPDSRLTPVELDRRSRPVLRSSSGWLCTLACRPPACIEAACCPPAFWSPSASDCRTLAFRIIFLGACHLQRSQCASALESLLDGGLGHRQAVEVGRAPELRPPLPRALLRARGGPSAQGLHAALAAW